MSKSPNPKQNASLPAPAVPGRQPPHFTVIILVVAVVVAAGLWWNKGGQVDAPPTVATEATANATNQPAPAASPSPNLGFEKLKGKWRRPDGGYIVEIRSVEPDGKMAAAYFNPRPINVAKAEASHEGAVTKVFIELRDVNYPGSTYNLVYEAASDQLTGIYYQAAIQQNYEVVFARME